MRTKYRILILGLTCGLAAMLLDAFFDVIFFYHENHFLDILIFKSPPHEYFFRLIILFSFVSFGYLIGKFIENREENLIKIKQSEENFLKVFNFNPDAIIITRVSDAIILQINETFEKLFLFTSEQLIGRTLPEFNIWKDLSKRKDFFEILQKDKRCMDFTAEFKRGDGTKLFMEISGTNIKFDNQDCWITYGKDITEKIFAEEAIKKAYAELEEIVRKRTDELEQINLELELTNQTINNENIEKRKAEIALKESEERYRSLLNQIPVGVYRTTIEGRFLQVSPALATILECESVDDLINSSVFDFYENEDVRNISLEKLKSMNPVFQDEIQLVTRNGNKIWVRDKGRVVTDSSGEILFIDGIIENITSKKEIEQALYIQSAINSTIAELSKEILSTPNAETASASILSNAVSLTNSRFGFVGLVNREQNELIISALNNENSFDFENQKINLFEIDSDGLGSWILNNNNSLLLNFTENENERDYLFYKSQKVKHFLSCPVITDEEIAGVIVLADSMVEYSIQDLEIIEQLSSLFAIAIQRHKAETEIQKALEREHELNELKSRFISMISHEYRTPLQSILLSTQLLMDYKEHLSDEEKNKYFDRIQKSVSVMNSLLDDTISLNKFDLSKLERNDTLVNLEDFCSDITRKMQFIAGNKCKITNKFINVTNLEYLDATLVREILVNLISNAIKYSFYNTEIRFITEIQDENIKFTISDNGIGIPINETETLFEPFYRALNTGTISGTGLGLSIVKNTVDFLGGKVEFETEENVGTTFKIILPRLYRETNK